MLLIDKTACHGRDCYPTTLVNGETGLVPSMIRDREQRQPPCGRRKGAVPVADRVNAGNRTGVGDVAGGLGVAPQR